MNIGIIDADLMDNGTRHPNLALMKIAGYHISIGDNVSLIYDDYNSIQNFEKVYISCVFSFTYVPKWVLESENVVYGGTGFFEDGGTSLPENIEHFMPYYDLYSEYIEMNIKRGKSLSKYSDYLNYSIGFTTRGCFRKCNFCVNKKYNSVQIHSNVTEFVDKKRPMIYLWDDNILAYPYWEGIIDELDATGKPFQFRQGMDIRLLTDRKAYRLNQARYHGDFIFAFDYLSDKEKIVSKIQLWRKYTNKFPKMYVLTAYTSQDASDIGDTFERIKILMQYGCLPFIMRYEKYKESKYRTLYTQIARWCNQPQFFKKMSFREFCVKNQFYHVNPNTTCASLQALIDFEEEQPDIAGRYFDLKLINENIYDINYGFGRKFYNKQECHKCKTNISSWDSIVKNDLNTKEITDLYYNRHIDLSCLKYRNAECHISEEDAGKFLCDFICKSSKDVIINSIKDDKQDNLNKDNFVLPMETDEYYLNFLYNLFGNSINGEITIKEIIDLDDSYTLRKKQEIFIKLRLLTLMDFLIMSKNNINGKVKLSALGKVYLELDRKNQKTIFNNNIFRLPIIQYYLINGEELCIEKLNHLNIKEQEKVFDYIKEITKR